MFVSIYQVGFIANIMYSYNTTIRKICTSVSVSLYKESFRIRMEANCRNRDGGAYNLPTTYDRILVRRWSPYAWWSSPLANETSQLGTDFCVWLCYMNILSCWKIVFGRRLVHVRPKEKQELISGDEIANVNFYAVRPEGTRIRWNNPK